MKRDRKENKGLWGIPSPYSLVMYLCTCMIGRTPIFLFYFFVFVTLVLHHTHKFAVSATWHTQGHPEIWSTSPTHSTGFSSILTRYDTHACAHSHHERLEYVKVVNYNARHQRWYSSVSELFHTTFSSSRCFCIDTSISSAASVTIVSSSANAANAKYHASDKSKDMQNWREHELCLFNGTYESWKL